MTDRSAWPEQDPTAGSEHGWQQPAGSPPPLDGHPAGPGYPSPYGYGYPNPYGYLAAPQTSGRAIAVMVLGILSLTMCWLGLVPAIVAVAMASRARREIEESGGRLTGLGMVTAGRITSWITIGFVGVFAIIFMLAVIFASANGPVTPLQPTELPG